ncbi:MAG: hypothetical protein HZB39_09745 [Planctomycetes bacterium]|nr:hypothetical protein [Planctomycetota bacterium]
MSRTLVLATLTVVFLGMGIVPCSFRGRSATFDACHRGIALGPAAGFVENLGQWPDSLRFAAARDGRWLHVVDGALVAGDHGRALRFTHGGAAAAMHGVAPRSWRCNFLFGPDQAEWVRGARAFASVRIDDVAPGIDLVVREAIDGGAFAYDLVLDPGADAGALEFTVDGASRITVDDASGELVLDVSGSTLRQSAPIAWSLDAGGARVPLVCRFELRAADRFGFLVGCSDPQTARVIDPDLRWATCVGGTAIDDGFALGVARNGDAFVAGSTQSLDLATSAGVFDPTYNGSIPTPRVVGDCYVARLAASDGRLLWISYLGGVENDRLVACDAIGDDPILTGWTTSLDFPVTPLAFDTSHNGTGDGYVYSGGDVFVTRVTADGTNLVWSSFLGGAMLEYPTSMAVLQNGEVAVSGHVHSTNFPTTPGAYSSARRAFSDAFVTRFAADGSALLGSTYFGGADGEEYPFAMAFDPQGGMVIAGATDSNDLPVTPGAWDTTFNGGSLHFADGFVARFDPTASTLTWSTYLGTPSNEYPRGIAMESDGSMTLTGAIDGPGLPVSQNAFDPTHSGGFDGFAWRLSADGSATLSATYVGGSADDIFERCAPLGGGRVAISGSTLSADAPRTRGALLSSPLGANDGWLVVLSSDASSVDYATLIGGRFGDRGLDVRQAPDGALVTAGTNYSPDYATTPGTQTYRGGGDAYCQALAALPLGVSRHGAPSGACARGARVMARSGPFVGEPRFELSAGDVPTASPALALVALGVLAAPLPLLGIDVWVDPNSLVVSTPVLVDARACAHLPLAVPATSGLAGATIAVQFAWLDACPGYVLGASDAVRVVIQL